MRIDRILSALILGLSIALLGLEIRDGLQAYACGSNPYLSFCASWTAGVPR